MGITLEVMPNYLIANLGQFLIAARRFGVPRRVTFRLEITVQSC